jgi:APA family basic amino acid/polyamine antiporter
MGHPIYKDHAAWQAAELGVVPAEAEDANDLRWRASGRLRRSFRKRDGIALIVSNVVGVGIFTTPAIVAGLVPNPMAMLTVWLVGGGLALAGATSYARLANLWPTAGGEYVYLSKTYGPAAGFLSGWTSLIAGFSGSVAASAVAVVLFAGQYFPWLASGQVIASQNILGVSIGLSSRTLAAAAIITLFAVLHICSLAAGKITQNALATGLVGMIAVFVVRGFATGKGSWSNFHSPDIHFGVMNWLLALIPVMFTYSGWNAAAYVSEEIHASRRSMRPVLLGGTAIVIALYTVLNALYLYAVPIGQMRSSSNVADSTARSLFGAGWNLITPALIVALLGAVSAMTIAGPRVYFAMARDGAFIPAFGRTSRRFGTPALAIALQALWSIALVMLGGFEHILMYTGFAIVLSSGAAVAGLFVVQRRGLSAGAVKPVRLVVPAVFVLASAAMVVDTVLDAPRIALIGVLLIAAGIPVYALCRRSSSPRPAFQPEEVAAD